MAVRKAVESNFKLVPEGEQVLMITKVDDSKYKDFEKITINFEDANGGTCRSNFNFVKDDGEPNEVAEQIYTRLGRAALGDQTLDEIDYEDFPGKFILVEIEHTVSNGNTYANIKKIVGSADPFVKKAAAPTSAGAGKKSAAEIIAEMKAKKAAKAGA